MLKILIALVLTANIASADAKKNAYISVDKQYRIEFLDGDTVDFNGQIYQTKYSSRVSGGGQTNTTEIVGQGAYIVMNHEVPPFLIFSPPRGGREQVTLMRVPADEPFTPSEGAILSNVEKFNICIQSYKPALQGDHAVSQAKLVSPSGFEQECYGSEFKIIASNQKEIDLNFHGTLGGIERQCSFSALRGDVGNVVNWGCK